MSRLISDNYCDEGAAPIATKSPTIQRFARRVILSVAASQNNIILNTRDITQRYIQVKTTLERTVYLKPPP